MYKEIVTAGQHKVTVLSLYSISCPRSNDERNMTRKDSFLLKKDIILAL